MKIKNPLFIICLMFILGMIASIIFQPQYAGSATISKGYTFTTNEQVTNTKLHTLVDSATISGIVSADITAGAIGNAQLAANAVGANNIQAGAVTAASIANASITQSLLATNSIGGVVMQTNGFFPSGIYNFTNANTSINFTNATLGFSNNQIPFSSVSNVVSLSIGSSKAFFSTNLTADVPLVQNAWTNLFTYTTTLGSNTALNVTLTGGVDNGSPLIGWVLTDGATNYFASPGALNSFFSGTFMQIITSNVTVRAGFQTGGAGVNLKQNPTAGGSAPMANATSMRAQEIR